MLTNISKKIELTANLAIIVVACSLMTVLVKNYLVTKHAEQASTSESQPANSPTVSALDIDWRQSKQTLLLAVSSGCHFCTESAPFYKQLAEAGSDPIDRLVTPTNRRGQKIPGRTWCYR